MTRKEFLTLLDEILEEAPGTVKGPELLQEDLKGWNSLAVLSFIAVADEKFEINVSPTQISRCKTVDDLVALMDGKVTDEA